MPGRWKVIVDGIDKKSWEDFANEFADHSIYQSWAYQQVRSEKDRQELSRIVIKDEMDRIVTMAQVRIKHCGWLGLHIGYVQWGPLFRKKDGTMLCSADSLCALADAYLNSRVNVLRMVPNIVADERGAVMAGMLRDAGFTPADAVEPYWTMMFEVDADDEELRRRFHRSWRRGLNKAEQAGLQIEESRESKAFETLEEIYLGAKKRKGFRGLEPREFIKTQEQLPSHKKMNVITVLQNTTPLAAHASSHFGDTAVGALAASTPDGLEQGAGYLLWWHTFLAARREGMKRYDLGGIDPTENPSVYQFKMRMGAKECRYIGAFEICAGRCVRTTWRTVESMYRRIKK